ncbi:hypothetical protein FRC06_009552 [Ceratobasidium sp. 370]|nr:hypothetical protein FRC06_009552 [Ceratobasidium sp. 370]
MEGESASGSKMTTSVSSAIQGDSGGFSTPTRSLADPAILDILRKFEECHIDNLLRALLKACQADTEPAGAGPVVSIQPPPSSMETVDPPQGGDQREDHGLPSSDSDTTINGGDLLEKYLTFVLEVCEDEQLRELLNQFCTLEAKQLGRYPLFVKFANYALDKLYSSFGETPGLRRLPDTKILFHQHNERKMPNKSDSVTRLPDLVLVSLAAVRRVYSKPDCDYQAAMRLCVKEESEEPEEPKEKRKGKPKGKREEKFPAFSAREMLSTIELKWNYSPVKSELPSSYTTGQADPVSAIHFPTMNYSRGQNSQGFGGNSSVENLPPASGTPSNMSERETSSNTLSSVSGSGEKFE